MYPCIEANRVSWSKRSPTPIRSRFKCPAAAVPVRDCHRPGQRPPADSGAVVGAVSEVQRELEPGCGLDVPNLLLSPQLIIKVTFHQINIFAPELLLASLITSPTASGGLYTDPLGDAVTGGADQGVVAIDATSISVRFNPTEFLVEMTFNPATPIAAPSSGLPNAIGGAIEFDVDRDPATGFPGFNDLFRPILGEPSIGLGVDGFIDLVSEASHPGLVDVYLGLSIVETVPISFTPARLSLSFSRSAFGGADVVDFAAIVGDSVGPTDAAPSTFGTSSAVSGPSPVLEPSTLTLLGTGVFGLLGYAWRQRKCAGSE